MCVRRIKMSDKKELEPLYKKITPYSWEYMCMETGNKCVIATEHFTEYNNAVKYMAENKINHDFFSCDYNLCVAKNCPVWNNVQQKIAENSKSKVK